MKIDMIYIVYVGSRLIKLTNPSLASLGCTGLQLVRDILSKLHPGFSSRYVDYHSTYVPKKLEQVKFGYFEHIPCVIIFFAHHSLRTPLSFPLE